MRFQNKKNIRPRDRAGAVLGVVGVLMTALPAFAVAAPTAFTPVCGVVGTPVTITGSGLTGHDRRRLPGALNQTTSDEYER